MVQLCLTASPLKTLTFITPPLPSPSPPSNIGRSSSLVTFLAPPLSSSLLRYIGRSPSRVSFRRFEHPRIVLSIKTQRRSMKQLQAVVISPVDEKFTRPNPLDFPIEWEIPKPWSRPYIFPKFSPLKIPLPPPIPYDPPPQEDEEEEEEEEDGREKEDGTDPPNKIWGQLPPVKPLKSLPNF